MDPIHSQYNSLHSHLPTNNDRTFTALTIKIHILQLKKKTILFSTSNMSEKQASIDSFKENRFDRKQEVKILKSSDASSEDKLVETTYPGYGFSEVYKNLSVEK